MRVVVTGGGTGGHLFPGIALARGLQKKIPGCRVLFIGTSRLLDQQALAGYDFEQDSIECGKLKGMGMMQRFRAVMQLPKALLQAGRILSRFKPDLVFGVGGYVTGPVLVAAWLRRIPLCIHEQNSVPGLTNRILARIVTRIFLSLPSSYPFPEKKTVLSGNPVRDEIVAAAAGSKQTGKKKQTVLVLGGSQGAHRVNLFVAEAVELLDRDFGSTLSLIHQTGTADHEEIRERYGRLAVQAEVQPFFRDMAGLYSQADLVVSRAGATTLAELAVMGLPALLIPYPFAADDHQMTNGLYFQDGGAAEVLPEKELTPGKLADRISHLLDAPAELARMSAHMRKLGRPDATGEIVSECLNLIRVRSTEH